MRSMSFQPTVGFRTLSAQLLGPNMVRILSPAEVVPTQRTSGRGKPLRQIDKMDKIDSYGNVYLRRVNVLLFSQI